MAASNAAGGTAAGAAAEASRIFVFAGTADGRQLVTALLAKGFAVTASVVSRYGGELLESAQTAGHDLVVNVQPLDEAGLVAYCRAHAIAAIVDASHPYAVNVSENAMAAAKALGLPYLRYERSLSELDYDNIHIVHSYEAAAEIAASLGNTIFLTTGSRNLKKFTEAPALQEKTIIARVLPTPDVIAQCIDLGIAPGQIVALQGPFSEALNRELFLRYHADVIVTKNSGDIGGTDTKLAAAKALHLPVVLIDRPKMEYPAVAHMMEDVADWLHC